MSEYDAAMYERFSNAVRRQVQSLRIILDSLQVSCTPQYITHTVGVYFMYDCLGWLYYTLSSTLQNKA